MDESAPSYQGALVASVATLKTALGRYEQDQSGSSLDQAFRAAGAAVAIVRGERAGEPPDVGEVASLFDRLPAFERLVSVAVARAEASAQAQAVRLWSWLGLAASAPGWTVQERARAQLLIACACAPLDEHVLEWLGPRLQKLAAERWAALLVEELTVADEEVWRRALQDRFDSVRQRFAPRTKRRTLELSALPASDPRAAEILRGRLAQWLAAGGDVGRLPAEIEAALVQSRMPARTA